MKQITVNLITQLVTPILEQEEVKLCGVKISGMHTSPLIQLFVDYIEGHITIGHCSRLNRQVRDLLDADADAFSACRLEVSSPGIDWPLTDIWQFQKNIGRLIHLNARQDGESDFPAIDGRIVSVFDDGTIRLEQSGDEIDIDYQKLSGAKVVIELFSKKKPRKRNEKRSR